MTLVAARAMLPVTYRLDHQKPRLNYFRRYARFAHRLSRRLPKG